MSGRERARLGPPSRIHEIQGTAQDHRATGTVSAVPPAVSETKTVDAGSRTLVRLAAAATFVGLALLTGAFALWLYRANGTELVIGALSPAALGFLVAVGLQVMELRRTRRHGDDGGGYGTDQPVDRGGPDTDESTDWDRELARLVEADRRTGEQPGGALREGPAALTSSRRPDSAASITG